MGKTRGLFKKLRDTKGKFHAKMGSIKDKNGMDLTEAEDIKKKWQEYTEELFKTDLHDPNNHDGVITQPEPVILEYHQVGDAIQPSPPLSSPSPLAPNPSQHQSLFQRVDSSHEVAKVLEFQLQCQSFQ